MARPSQYPPELRQRAVRMVAEVRPNYKTESAAMAAVAHKLGIGSRETLRNWVRQAEIDAGQRPGTTSEEAVDTWVKETWPRERAAAVQNVWVCFKDEAGRILRPPKARTWSRRGITPVTEASGRGSGRVSIAGLVCFQPGCRGLPARFLYRTREHRGRKGERRSFSERDYISLLDAAHRQLDGPIMLVWDNCETQEVPPGPT